MAYAAKLEAAYQPVIEDAMRQAARNLKARTRVLVSAAGWTPPDGDELVNLVALMLSLNEAGEDIRVAAMERVIAGYTEQLGINLNLRNPFLDGVLAGQGVKIRGIAEDVRAGVMAQVNQGWEDGLSVADTALAVQQVAPSFSASRAATIARTEINGVCNMGSLAAAQISGAAPYKQWLSTLDNKTRPWHAELDGETVPIGDAFSNGMMVPGDPGGDPADVVNCRCTVIYSDTPEGNDLSGREDRRSLDRLGAPSYMETPQTTWPSLSATESAQTMKGAFNETPLAVAQNDLAQIEGIHRLPAGAPDLNLDATRLGGSTYGSFNPMTNTIRLNSSFAEEWSETFNHEFGHYVDHALGRTLVREHDDLAELFGDLGTASDVVQFDADTGEWLYLVESTTPETMLMSSLITSPAIDRIAAKYGQLVDAYDAGVITATELEREGTWLTYLLTSTEMFARAYAEYVAWKAGPFYLDLFISQHGVMRSWPAEEFDSIGRALDRYFREKGLAR